MAKVKRRRNYLLQNLKTAKKKTQIAVNPLIIGVCTLPDTVWISDEVITCIAKVLVVIFQPDRQSMEC